MIRHLLRPVHGLSLLICLVLAGCSGQPEKPATNVTPAPATASSPEANSRVRQRLGDLNQRIARIHERIRDLNDEQVRQLDALTSETEALQTEIAAIYSQMGGKPQLAARPVSPAGKPAATAAPVAGQPGRGPLGPLARGLLIIIALFAIWIMARIFLGRLGEEEEDDEEFGVDAADEDLGSDEAPLHRVDPDVRATGEKPGQSPHRGAEDERDEPKP